ncbi:hypothetical protein N0V94_007076 [Neodidymelliopsis sp. IMI 364377]|nr:hypothetical protein N0V94_007076 [Neodidymelliopsis sp. IMI 364377]
MYGADSLTLHLVWFEAQLFVKPLPDYLLDYDHWSKHLCSDEELYHHKIDLKIAQEMGLVSADIQWPAWVEFLETFLDNINLITLEDVSTRYKYGEL